MKKKIEFPAGWVWTTLESVTDINPRIDLLAFADDTPVSFVRMAAVEEESGRIDVSQVRPLNEVRRGYTSFQNGDVLFAKITPCMENGKSAVADGLSSGIGFGSTEFHVLRPAEKIDAALLRYFLSQQSYRQAARSSMTGTAGQLRLPPSYLAKTKYPLPPLAEQRRIVAAIEERFTRLDAGVTALRRAQAALKRYRSAVLKAAVEGRLTADRRAAHPDAEPASALLRRILAERRARWEVEQRAKGKDPGKAHYDEPAAPDTANLPALPEGWVWATVEQVAAAERYSLAIGPFGSNLKVEDYRTEGVPLVFVRNIRSGIFDGPDTRYVSHDKAIELQAHEISYGDILITKMGDPPGDACLYPDGQPNAIITADCIKWRLSHHLQSRLYFVHAVNSQVVRPQVLNITKGVAQLKVSLERFSGVAIPLPSLSEQEQIVAEVEQRLSVVNELEATVEANLKRAERLRQAILARAFSGRLVAQEAGDEPASALLERVRAERDQKCGGKREKALVESEPMVPTQGGLWE